MGDAERILLQIGTALATVYLGIWIYRNPRKTLLLYGDLANRSLPQKFVAGLGSLCIFVGIYAVVVISLGRSLPDVVVGIVAAISGITVVWWVKRIDSPSK